MSIHDIKVFAAMMIVPMLSGCPVACGPGADMISGIESSCRCPSCPPPPDMSGPLGCPINPSLPGTNILCLDYSSQSNPDLGGMIPGNLKAGITYDGCWTIMPPNLLVPSYKSSSSSLTCGFTIDKIDSKKDVIIYIDYIPDVDQSNGQSIQLLHYNQPPGIVLSYVGASKFRHQSAITLEQTKLAGINASNSQMKLRFQLTRMDQKPGYDGWTIKAIMVNTL